MAAAPGLLLWLLLLGPLWWVPGQSHASPGRLFSDLKLCGDKECSMLMYYGEALEDFTGPDCRFVNFKKGDYVYVYYKLAGASPEVWAGSVGHFFGYFPKDSIKVHHRYIEEELKIPADETDFVCFDGGRDDFDSYNVEELLGFLKRDETAPGRALGVRPADSASGVQPTAGHIDHEDERKDLLVEHPTTKGEKHSEKDPELVISGEEKETEESGSGLAHLESEPEGGKAQTVTADLTSTSKLSPLPASEKGKEFTEALHREIRRDSLQSEPGHTTMGSPVVEINSKHELPHPGAIQETQAAERPEVPSVPPGQPEAEDDHPPEELLEDENAVSAQQSKENHPSVHDRSDTNPQVRLGILNLGTKENETTITILDVGEKGETTPQEGGGMGKESSSMAADGGESHMAEVSIQGPPQADGLHEKTAAQTPGFKAMQSTDPDALQKDNPEELVDTLGLENPRGEEISEGGPETTENLGGSESQGPETGDLLDGRPWQPTPEIPEIVLNAVREDLPIINNYFQEDQQSLYRFLKYFDVHELEGMLQDMAVRLKSAHRDSLPYNVEKVLDKVFRDYESRILSAAERMFDTQMTINPGLKENSVLEEAAVLEDIQDLIYFVRYLYSGEKTAPPATLPPMEDVWAEPGEEMQPPQQNNLPQENTDDLSVQLPEESGFLDQPVTGYTSASEASQKQNTEKDTDLGLLVNDGSPAGAGDALEQLETSVEEPANDPPLENTLGYIYSFIFYLIATFPDNVQPVADFYGIPWQPVIITAVLGILSFAVFSWRTILVVKSTVYEVTEKQISKKLETIKKENKELIKKLSNCEKKINESKKYIQETEKKNMILSDEAIKYKDTIKLLEETNATLIKKAKSLHCQLESQRENNAKNQDLILENKKSIKKLKDVILMKESELSEVQIAFNKAKLSEEKIKCECHRVQEENVRLKKKKEELQHQIEEWSKSYTKLTEQVKQFEQSQRDLEAALTHKDNNISALTNCITQLNRLECELETEDPNKGENESDELANGEVGGDRSEKIKNRIRQLMDVSRTQTAFSIVQEDLKLLQVKLRTSMSVKCDLEDQVKKLEGDHNLLQTTKARLEDECKSLKQKVEILNELYQEKEMALQKKLHQEEYERQTREQRLSAADEKVGSAAEEIKSYKRRIEEMEKELQKTERSFKDQIATQEKKAHDNWLKARAAERAMAEEKIEAANLRHKLLEMAHKMAMIQDEHVIVKPMPGRPNTQNPSRQGPLSHNGSYGPSPVSGECSPPLPAEAPGRPLSATLSRRDMPRSELVPLDRHSSRPRPSSEASGKHSAPDPGPAPVVNTSSTHSSPAKAMDEGKQTVRQEPEGPSVSSTTPLAEHPVAVYMAPKATPPFPGVPLLGGPVPRPIRYGPPPQLYGPFGPRPIPPPYVPGLRPPLGLREYAPGVLPGKRDLPVDPREFLPGHPPFRPPGPLGPREFFIPGTQLPPPAHGPQNYTPPPPAARDSLPSGLREEAPPASPSRVQGHSQASKASP
ncbi:transport and Golgi organization protein 1 homolog isoform X2 [Meriones unguiculatus]|uniref:transport and Golgi organization protein 1 homolog isoform X2 n=1 Tax=Meriones unguiculatus TaxID=10047 RepID=UPI000B4E865D|nr:transport and Golgi organization protein 1 homolog isoform X2 [Meriones unguiculatus]